MIPDRLRLALRVCRVVLGALLLAGVALVLASTLPGAFGFQTLIVYSGSMEPAIPTGSTVINQAVDPASIRPGDVITFRAPAGNVLITHRVVAVEPGPSLAFRTKGDANQTEDPAPVRAAEVVSVNRATIPFSGYLLHFVGATSWGRLAVLALAALFRAQPPVRHVRERPAEHE